MVKTGNELKADPAKAKELLSKYKGAK